MDSFVRCPRGYEPAGGRDGARTVSDRNPRRKDQEHNASSRQARCPQCECGFLVIQQCRLICENCGYVEGCEDNFVPNQDNPKKELLKSG